MQEEEKALQGIGGTENLSLDNGGRISAAISVSPLRVTVWHSTALRERVSC